MTGEKYAFKMKLNPGMAAEYKRRHDLIWPELVAHFATRKREARVHQIGTTVAVVGTTYAQTLTLPEHASKRYVLHPVQRSPSSVSAGRPATRTPMAPTPRPNLRLASTVAASMLRL